MDQYNESLSVDRVMYSQDIKGSIAYARANVKTGILTKEEFATIEKGLGEIMKEWEEGKFESRPGDEGKQASVDGMRNGHLVLGRGRFGRSQLLIRMGGKISTQPTNAVSVKS